jgi:hypothetical protein
VAFDQLVKAAALFFRGPWSRAGAATASVLTWSHPAQMSPSGPPKTSPFSSRTKKAAGYHSACLGGRNVIVVGHPLHHAAQIGGGTRLQDDGGVGYKA